MRLLILSIVGVMLLALPVGCRKSEVIWTQAHNFKGNKWERDKAVEFIPDSGYFVGDGFRGVLSVRYGRNCPAEVLPVKIEIEALDCGGASSDTIRVAFLPGNLRDGNRSTLGVFETVDTISLSYPPADGWRMYITNISDTVISDIYSLTLQIIPK